MPPNRILVDSSFLFALYNRDDPRSTAVSVVADLYAGQFLIPYVVLTEAAYLARRARAIQGAVAFLDALVKADYTYEIVSPVDLARARDIMAAYRDARFDFVDCCIMALAERLQITQVCTLDQRDFGIFRPTHVDYLDILP